VNQTELEAISDPDQPTQQTSAEDEDPNEEVINDLEVIAEVKLPSTIRKFNLFYYISESLFLKICPRT
jgi:hypothetical protein